MHRSETTSTDPSYPNKESSLEYLELGVFQLHVSEGTTTARVQSRRGVTAGVPQRGGHFRLHPDNTRGDCFFFYLVSFAFLSLWK